jgi:hypothetical protein
MGVSILLLLKKMVNGYKAQKYQPPLGIKMI